MLELCGQSSPKYSVSRSTIAGVLMPRKFVAFNTAHSSRLVCETIEGMTDDWAIAKASTAAWVMPILWAVHPTKVCSPVFRPVLATREAMAPSPCHCAAVAMALMLDRPAASSLLAVSVTQTRLLARTDAVLPASKVSAMTSGGPVHLGSRIGPGLQSGRVDRVDGGRGGGGQPLHARVGGTLSDVLGRGGQIGGPCGVQGSRELGGGFGQRHRDHARQRSRSGRRGGGPLLAHPRLCRRRQGDGPRNHTEANHSVSHF